jgi:hypothetical protein
MHHPATQSPTCAKRALSALPLARRRAQRGQAVVEILAGIVALTVLFLGLLQVATLGHANVRNLMEARGQAEDRAYQGDLLSRSSSYIGGWSASDSDGLRYTADDVSIGNSGGSLNTFSAVANSPMALDGLNNHGANPDFASYLSADSLGVAASLHEGSASRTVAIEPGLRWMIVRNRSNITLTDHLYMPSFNIE